MMLKGDKKNKTAPDSPERLNRLVQGTNLTGDLNTESNLRVDGTIKGTVGCKGKFVLGQSGRLDGDLTALEAEIEGTIFGDVKIDDLLVLRKTAIIKGTVTTGRLVIEDGAQLGGAIETGDIPSNTNKGTKTKAASADVVY